MKKLLATLLLFTSYAAADPIAQYQQQAKTYGDTHCAAFKSGTYSPYAYPYYAYDPTWAFHQLGRDDCAAAALATYKAYATSAGGGVPGFQLFTAGPRAMGDAALVKLLADNAAYCKATAYNDNVILHDIPTENPSGYDLIREASYCLMAKTDAYRTGSGLDPRAKSIYLEAILRDIGIANAGGRYVKGFYHGLASESLIQYLAEVEYDSRILPVLRTLGDTLWLRLWRPDSHAMLYEDIYTDDPGVTPAPDLNLLIAPLYAWLAKVDADPKWASRRDALFQGGVEQAYLVPPKQWNQQYRNYAALAATAAPTAQPSPSPTPTIAPTATPTPRPTATATRTPTPTPCKSIACVNKRVDDHERRIGTLEHP